MGSVLAFAPRDAASTRDKPAVEMTASIVIFPGVRYERREETPLPRKPQRRDARRETSDPMR